MARHIDLDQVEAEAGGEPVTVAYKSVEFELPSACPAEFVKRTYAVYQAGESMDPEGLFACLEPLFGERFEEFRALNPSFNAILALIDQVLTAYGLEDMGESSASGGSSPSNGTPSRPTSSASTDSTSEPSSSEASKQEPADSSH